MVLFSFPFLPKGAAAGHCHLEDIRLTRDLMPSLRPHFLQNTSTCHSSRTVPWLRPSGASSTKLVKSQVTHSWSGTPLSLGWQGWVASCRESAGGQFTWARLMRLKSNRVEQKQSSHSQRSSRGPVTSAVGVCALNPPHATTKVCLCRKDLQNAASVKATPRS